MAYFNYTRTVPGSYVQTSSSIYGTTVQNMTSNTAEKFEERRTGSVNTAYYRMVKAGMELPPLGYTYEKIVSVFNYGTFKTDWHDSYQQFIIRSGSIGLDAGPAAPGWLNLSPAELASLDARARSGVLLKIKDQKVNLVQAYAESEQTVKLISDAATKIAKTLVNLKRGNFRAAAESLGIRLSKRKLVAAGQRMRSRKGQRPTNKEVTQEWLALQYGWKPLLDDIYGTAELAAQKVSREVVNRVVSSKKINRTAIQSSSAYGWDFVDRMTCEVTYRYVLKFSVSDEVSHAISQMGITNPATIAWELLPWSFVIDWFIPIGNWINSFDATLGTKFVSGSCTVFTKQSTKRESSASSFAGAIETRGFLESSITRVNVSRNILISYPSVPNPQFKNPLSFLHAANAISLLNQLRK